MTQPIDHDLSLPADGSTLIRQRIETGQAALGYHRLSPEARAWWDDYVAAEPAESVLQTLQSLVAHGGSLPALLEPKHLPPSTR